MTSSPPVPADRTKVPGGFLFRALLVFLGFYGIHLLWLAFFVLYTLIRNKAQYLGTDIPLRPEIFLGHFLIRITTDPLIVAALVGLGAACHARFLRQEPSRWSLLGIGLASYIALNALLLLQAPGGMVAVVGLRRIPFAANFALLSSVALMAILAAFRGQARRHAFAWMGMLLALTWLPHDTFRAARHWFSTKLPPDRPRVLMLVIDAARFDEVDAAFRNLPALRPGLGVSHFNSTRKQWRLLLTGNAAEVERHFFIPSRQELTATKPDDMLPLMAGKRGMRTTFLIDDPLTANRNSLGLEFDNYRAPSRGILDAMLADTALFPLGSWLWNIIGPVEGTNAWSHGRVFLRDVARAAATSDIVFAHTVALEKPPASFGEFTALYGYSWLWRRPKDYHLIYERKDIDGGIDALAVYRLKLKSLLDQYPRWSTNLATKYPALSGFLTSDHGQAFDEVGDGSGRHFSGLHGWELSPATVWTPIVPFGLTRFSGPDDGISSWLDLRQSLLEWLPRPGPFVIARSPEPVTFRIHYIVKSQITGEKQDAIRPDLVTMARIVAATRLDWNDGWFLSPEFQNMSFRYCVGTAEKCHLTLANPSTSGAIIRTEWDLYQPRGSAGTNPPAP